MARWPGNSLVFDDAYIGSFPTVPNRRDLFTGRFTFAYSDWSPLTPEETVISEVLGKQGYLTMFIADTPHTTAPGYNYQRGFSGWLKIRGQEGDPIVTESVDIKLPASFLLTPVRKRISFPDIKILPKKFIPNLSNSWRRLRRKRMYLNPGGHLRKI